MLVSFLAFTFVGKPVAMLCTCDLSWPFMPDVALHTVNSSHPRISDSEIHPQKRLPISISLMSLIFLHFFMKAVSFPLDTQRRSVIIHVNRKANASD